MSSYLDKKFINMVSPQLEKFSWKKDNLAACRCPICGDSKKNKNKTRGYFYVKGNDFFYKRRDEKIKICKVVAAIHA